MLEPLDQAGLGLAATDTVKVVVATAAFHAIGDAKLYDGNEDIEANQPIVDSQGNLTFTDTGAVALYTEQTRRVTKKETFTHRPNEPGYTMVLELPDRSDG